ARSCVAANHLTAFSNSPSSGRRRTSQSTAAKEHMVKALSFELGKVTVAEIRRRMVDLLAQVHADLAAPVAGAIGIADAATTGGAGGALARLREDWERYGATAVPGERPANAPTEAPEVSLER